MAGADASTHKNGVGLPRQSLGKYFKIICCLFLIGFISTLKDVKWCPTMTKLQAMGFEIPHQAEALLPLHGLDAGAAHRAVDEQVPHRAAHAQEMQEGHCWLPGRGPLAGAGGRAEGDGVGTVGHLRVCIPVGQEPERLLPPRSPIQSTHHSTQGHHVRLQQKALQLREQLQRRRPLGNLSGPSTHPNLHLHDQARFHLRRSLS